MASDQAKPRYIQGLLLRAHGIVAVTGEHGGGTRSGHGGGGQRNRHNGIREAAAACGVTSNLSQNTGSTPDRLNESL